MLCLPGSIAHTIALPGEAATRESWIRVGGKRGGSGGAQRNKSQPLHLAYALLIGKPNCGSLDGSGSSAISFELS